MKRWIGVAIVFGLLGLLGLLGAPALHADPSGQKAWSERPYNPPVGSKWSIVSESTSNEIRAQGDRRNQKIVSRAELTIDEKLLDGYRITYVSRQFEMSGNAPSIAIMNRAFAGVKDIVVHGRIDAGGKPLAVDNLDEIKVTMRGVVDRTAESFATNPKVAAFVKEMMESALLVEGADAAKAYMEELPTLVAGQNTGLKPGDVDSENSTVSNPLTGPIKAVRTMQLASWDDIEGKARYTRRQSIDEETLRVAIAAIASRLMKASTAITPEMVEMIKKTSLSIESESTIAVEAGMTRSVEEHETSNASLMGYTVSKDERKTVTVTRLP